MAEYTIDVRRELDDAPVRPFHWLLVALVIIAITFDGYDTFVPVYTIQFVREPWGLDSGQAGFLISAGLIGFGVGSVVHGVVADRIGRRPTLIFGLLIAGFFSLLTALLANSFGTFVALRLLTGLGLGVLMPLGTAYLNECLPELVRNRFASLGQFGFSVGAVLASILGILYTRQYGWEVLFWIGGVGPIVVAGAFFFAFPESAEYLVARGKQEEAVRMLRRIRPDRTVTYQGATLRAPSGRQRGDWLLPTHSRYIKRSVALWVSSFLILFCIYGLSGWTPILMIERGEGFAAGFAFGAVLQGLSVLGGLTCGYFVDRRSGSRWSLVLWCALGAVASIVVAMFNTTVSNLIGIAAAGFFIIGSQYILNNLCAMTYPVHARGTGEGYMLGFGRLGGILGPTIGGVLLGAFGGTGVLFVAVAIAAALAMVSTFLLGDTPSRVPAEAVDGEVSLV